MKTRNLVEFFSLGYSSAILWLAPTDASIFDLNRHAKSFRDGLEKEGLRVSVRLLDQQVVRYLDAVVSESSKPTSNEQTEKILLTEEQRLKLVARCKEVFRAVQAELEDIPVFTPFEKRYTFSRLNGEVGKIFRENAFDSLDEMAQYDFLEAGQHSF